MQLLCSDTEVERRIGNASRSRFGKLTDPLIYREAREQGGFDFPPLPEPLLRLDTEQLSPAASAQAIVRAFEQL